MNACYHEKYWLPCKESYFVIISNFSIILFHWNSQYSPTVKSVTIVPKAKELPIRDYDKIFSGRNEFLRCIEIQNHKVKQIFLQSTLQPQSVPQFHLYEHSVVRKFPSSFKWKHLQHRVFWLFWSVPHPPLSFLIQRKVVDFHNAL